MSYWWFCRNRFTSNQYSAMLIYLGIYTPFIGNYFSHNGISFMNLNGLNITGDVYSGESEEYNVPEEIVNNGKLIVQNGGKLKLQAQKQIVLKPGFEAKAGSDFSAKIAPIEDCNATYKPSVSNKSARTSQNIKIITYPNDFQKQLASLIDNYLTKDTIDLNEQVTQNTSLSLDSIVNNSSEIIVYPTLLEDNRTINIDYNLPTNENILEISVFTMNGIKIDLFISDDFSSKGNIDLQINKINQSGHYILRIVTTKRVQTTRFIIAK